MAQFGGKTLDALMLSATLNPGQLAIVREIVDGDMDNSAIDMAVYGDMRANYTITSNADGSVTVEHVTVTVETDPTTGNNRVSDGIDRLFNIEKLRFADREVNLTPPKLSLHAFDAAQLSPTTSTRANYVATRTAPSNWAPRLGRKATTAARLRHERPDPHRARPAHLRFRRTATARRITSDGQSSRRSCRQLA